MTITLRRNIILVVTLISISLLLIVLDSRNRLDGPKGIAGVIVSPLSGLLTDFGDQVAGWGDGSETDVDRKLAQLQERYDALLAENAQLQEATERVAELEGLLRFQNDHPDLQTVSADVLLRDPQSREKIIIINRGSNDGVAVGMPVVSPNFFVGQVTEVEPNRARVLLVVDSGFQTGARLQGSDQDGIVYGQWQEGGRVVMRHVPIDTEVRVGEDGDLVVTSGRTEGVPAGLIIGKVLEKREDPLENEIELEVVPLVDLDDLQSVSVILGGGQ